MRTMADLQPPQPVARIAQQDEADLVARAVAGARAAFGILVERYAGVARRVARAVLGNAEDADDAAQDAMLSALVKLDQYDARRPFGPWLLRIVANAATDRRRRRSVRRVEPLDVGLTAGGPRPDTTAERRALNQRLREALDPGDAPVFIARVLAHAEHVRVASWDAVLARWARTGVAAALVVALAAGYFVGRATATSPRPTVSDVLIAPPAHPAEVEVVLASVIGNN